MEFAVSTQRRCQLVDVTAEVRRAVRASGVREGLCLVWCPHTTAGITVNENADPDVPADLLMGLDRVVDARWPFRHAEGNSDAHLKSSLVGCASTIAVRGGRPAPRHLAGDLVLRVRRPASRRVEVTVLAAGGCNPESRGPGPRSRDRTAAVGAPGRYRVSLRYLIRCGWSASVPRRFLRSASYSE